MRIFFVLSVVVIGLVLVLWLVVGWGSVLGIVLADGFVITILGLGLALLVFWPVGLFVLSLLRFLSESESDDVFRVETFDDPLFAKINIDSEVKSVLIVTWWVNADYLFVFGVLDVLNLFLKIAEIFITLYRYLNPYAIALDLFQLI